MELNNDTAVDSNKRNINEVDNVATGDDNETQRARLDERDYKTIEELFPAEKMGSWLIMMIIQLNWMISMNRIMNCY